MCGIFLVINQNINIETTLPIFKRLINRGPDYNHYWSYTVNINNVIKQIFLGQTTLSITGNYNINNFINPKGQILFNGEIYNYKKLIKNLHNHQHISNDTNFLLQYITQNIGNHKLETLHNLENMHKELDGMYAYVFYDNSKNLLYLARDIQGEKNLYYYKSNKNGLFIVSSELPLIVKYLKQNDIDVKLETDELNKYILSRHHMYRKKTIYEDIYQLEPGETIIYDIEHNQFIINSVKGLDTLIEPELYIKNSNIGFDEHLENFDKLFKDLCQNMVPDKHDYACIVSGGVDSTLSSYYFCHHTNKKPKYLIATNCVGKDKISDDLSIFTKYLGQDIITIPVTPDDYAKEIDVCQSVYGGPVATHSAITLSILARKVKELGIKVLLTGEGADELFGGYSTYLPDTNSIEYFNGLECNYSNYTKMTNANIKFKNNKFINEFKQELKHFWEFSKNKYKFIPTLERFYQASMLCDSIIQLPNVGLKSADLMCMNHGIESRTVFLRKPILKYILNSPLWLKLDMRTQYTKILLKELYLKYLPYRSLLPKQGFAGFPNESKHYLDNIKKQNNKKQNIDLCDYLGIEIDDTTRDVEWKLINMDYFVTKYEQTR